jgi:hypothetical protein
MSYILLVADWPNASLPAAVKEGLMSSSPVEYGFLHLAVCNGNGSVCGEAWEIIYFSILSEFLLRKKNSIGLLTRSEYFVLKYRVSRNAFIASFPK